MSHVEKLVRLYRRAERREELEDANERFAERYLQCYEGENGDVVINGRLARGAASSASRPRFLLRPLGAWLATRV